MPLEYGTQGAAMLRDRRSESAAGYTLVHAPIL